MNIDNTSSVGIFYKIRDENKNIKGYIYGTTHIIQNNSNFVLNDKVKRAFHNSNSLIVEADVMQDTRLLKAFKGENFNETLLKIKSHLIKFKEDSIDFHLIYKAYEEKKNIISLETLEEQKHFVEGYTNETRKNIKQAKLKLPFSVQQGKEPSNNPNSINYITEEEKIFINKDREFEKLQSITHITTDEEIIEKVATYGCSKDFYRKFNDDRNVKMVDKIDDFLKKSEKQFIAVGAGHLVGKNGIVNLLREKGWTLEKVEN